MMYQKVILSFVENPVTEEEKLIANIVRTYCISLQRQDYTVLASLFAEEARIHSLAAKDEIVSCDEFIRVLEANKEFSLSKIRFNNFRIRILVHNSALVSGYHQFSINGQQSALRTIELKLQKYLGSWRITELQYYPC